MNNRAIVHRTYRTANLAIHRRGEDGPQIIAGHASVFNQWTELGRGQDWCVREIILPGAFRNALQEKQDCRALINHDPNLILGRTGNGTLTLREDAQGLYCEIEPADVSYARDLMVSIGRRDITGMSFAFTEREGGLKTSRYTRDGMDYYDREVSDVDLYDVSPVVYPAYDGTDLGMRSRREIDRLIESIERERQAERSAKAAAQAEARARKLRLLRTA